MSRPRSLRARVVRLGALILAIGVAATAGSFWVVRSDVERLDRQRVDRPATQALLGVQQLMASVNQVLATADGVVATSGLDPKRFARVLGPDVRASSTLAGLALVSKEGSRARIAARVGDTHLLTNGFVALVPAASSALVASRHDTRSFELGFAALAAHGHAAVYLEIRLPIVSSGVPFALTGSGARPRVLVGDVSTVAGLTRWNQPVSFAGRSLTLFVRAGAAPGGLLGISLPTLVLIVGLILVALALAVGVVLARRDHAVQHLGVENRALDRALERQRLVESELRAAQERFRAILRDSPDVIVLYDVERDTCEVLNRPDLLGHPLDLVAAAGGLLALVEADDRAEADVHWGCMRDLAPERVCETTLRLRAADDELHYARLRFSPLALDAGEHPRLLGTISDVTEQRTNELREAELEEALRRSQRLETVGHLAGGVAHDFNNLLAAILASAELLSDDVPEGRPREYTEEIQRSAMRGAALVRQLLTFAQRDHAEPRVVDLNKVIAGMEPLLRRSLGEDVHLQITATGSSADVLADPTHLEQVVLNLAVNARDAMPSGGVLWIATAIDPDDDAPQNDRIVLSVTDTGVGIAPEIRPRMFEPFVTSKAPGKGTGLGLSTVQNIVHSMYGRIEVHSKVGEGTTFEISFARRFDPAEPPMDPVDPAARLLDGAGRRILLVEDDRAVRAVLGHTLESNGFAVTAVNRAAEALQAVEQRDFDVVLTDAVMPGMSGPDLIDHLRSAHPHLRVVLMSGYAQEIFDDSRPGSQLHLRKPFTTPELMAVLRQALHAVPAVESLS